MSLQLPIRRRDPLLGPPNPLQIYGYGLKQGYPQGIYHDLKRTKSCNLFIILEMA